MAKLLAIRLSALGDVVLCTPLLRWWKQQVPEAQVRLITGPAQAKLLQHDPNIDEIWVFQKEQLGQLRNQIQNYAPDLIADFQKNTKSQNLYSGLPFLSRKLQKQNLKKWRMVHGPKPNSPCRHVVQRMADVFSGFPVQDDGKGVGLYLPPSPPSWASELPKNYLAIALGSAHATKAISIELAQDLVKTNPDQAIVLLGGAAEQNKGEQVKRAAPQRVLNFCGRSNLLETAWLVKHAGHIISGDTAVMHMAAAFGKTMDVVWSSTIPEFGMEPYYGSQQNFPVRYRQVHDLKCRPCSKLGFKACPKGHFKCMNQIAAWNVHDKSMDGFSRPVSIV